jgi:mannose-1-phosphate guanylyltransferase
MLIQADLMRNPNKSFLRTIKEVEKLINKEKKLVTGGESPDFAVMGVDYLIVQPLPIKKNGINFYKMKKWLGRDSKEGVEKYLEDEAAFNHWNHYSWTPRLMLEAFKKYKPDWYEPLMKMIEAFGTKNEKKIVKEEYHKMPIGKVEEMTKYALNDAYIFEVSFECIDFGTWESLANYFRIHDKKRLFPENGIQIDSENCFLKLPKGKFGAAIGVKDIVVVDSGDALLVCHKDKAGEVGMIVDHLKNKEKENLL